MTQPITPATEQTSNLGQPQEPETTETAPKQPRFYPKTIQAIKLVSIGETPEEALKLVNNKNKITSGAVSHLRKKIRKYSLTHPKLVKLAQDVVLDTLKGEVTELQQEKVTNTGQRVEYIERIAPTVTNKLAAAAMVYDRFEPVKGSPEVINNSLTINAIPIAAQEIIDRMTSWKTRQVEGSTQGNVIDAEIS